MTTEVANTGDARRPAAAQLELDIRVDAEWNPWIAVNGTTAPPTLAPARGPPFFKSVVIRRRLGEPLQVELFDAH